MGEPIVAQMRALYNEIVQNLEAVRSGGDREEDIRVLVEKYKQLAQSTSGDRAPEFTGAVPAVRVDHIGASTFIEKGWSLISLGDYPGALLALNKALSLSPGDVQAESLLGWAQMLNEDYDDALATFQQVLMKEPANSLARINVGYICLKKGIFGEAIEHLSKAIRLDNDKKATLYAHFYLGLVYLERDMYEDAQTFFEKTLRLGPNLVEAYYELGRAQWFAGDREGAKGTWASGYKTNKFNSWGKRCKETLNLVERGQEPPRS
jgi:tetratricopeptide (TPR) repeat protein